MFKKQNEKAVAAADVRLQFSFEPDALIVQAEGLGRFRIEAADLGLLLDREAVKQALGDAGGIATRRIFDDEAVDKFVRIGRYLNHGLNFSQVAKLLGENESDLRLFYSWVLDQPASRGEIVKRKREELAKGDVLPLVRPRLPLRPGEGEIKEIPINALDVKRLLERDISKDGKGAAEILGISHGDLNAWLSANAEMMALLQ